MLSSVRKYVKPKTYFPQEQKTDTTAQQLEKSSSSPHEASVIFRPTMYEGVSMLSKPAGGKQPTPQPWSLPPEMSPYRRIWILILGAYALDWLGTMPRASKYAYLRQWAGLKPLKRSGGLAMMVMNLASPSERFEGFRLAHCQGKAYDEDIGG